MTREYPTIVVTAEMLRASRKQDGAWLKKRQAEADEALKQLAEKLPRLFR